MTSATHKSAEPEWQSGEADARGLQRVRLGDTSIELEVMIHGGKLSKLIPLLIVNSIDYPMPPSPAFCEKAVFVVLALLGHDTSRVNLRRGTTLF